MHLIEERGTNMDKEKNVLSDENLEMVSGGNGENGEVEGLTHMNFHYCYDCGYKWANSSSTALMCPKCYSRHIRQ